MTMSERRAEELLRPLQELPRVEARKQVNQSFDHRGRTGGWRASRVVGIAAIGLVFGGTAVAATGVWNPLVGDSNHPATLASTPVPAELIAHLGVLRREQTPQDRSAEVEATLKDGLFPPQGVRLDSVRYLAPGPNGEAVVLLSGVQTAYTEGEPFCVVRPFQPFPEYRLEKANFMCFDLARLMSGGAHGMNYTSSSGIAYGVVPDGVASLTAKFASAPDVTVPVKDNYWEFPVSGPQLSYGEPGVVATVWRDADGNVVRQQSGSSSRRRRRAEWLVHPSARGRKSFFRHDRAGYLDQLVALAATLRYPHPVRRSGRLGRFDGRRDAEPAAHDHLRRGTERVRQA